MQAVFHRGSLSDQMLAGEYQLFQSGDPAIWGGLGESYPTYGTDTVGIKIACRLQSASRVTGGNLRGAVER